MVEPRTRLLLGAALLFLLVPSGAAVAQDQDRDRIQLQDQTGDQVPDRDRDRLRVHQDDVYGASLMSEQERHEYSAKMSSLQTEAEREQFRVEHRARMQERAGKMGVVLPGEPDPQMHEEAIRLRPQPQSMPEMPGMGGGGGGRGR